MVSILISANEVSIISVSLSTATLSPNTVSSLQSNQTYLYW